MAEQDNSLAALRDKLTRARAEVTAWKQRHDDALRAHDDDKQGYVTLHHNFFHPHSTPQAGVGHASLLLPLFLLFIVIFVIHHHPHLNSSSSSPLLVQAASLLTLFLLLIVVIFLVHSYRLALLIFLLSFFASPSSLSLLYKHGSDMLPHSSSSSTSFSASLAPLIKLHCH